MIDRRPIYVFLTLLLALAGCGASQGPGSGSESGNDWESGPRDEAGPALHDTIAYVTADGRDEIRAIAPDGTNDRSLWTHGRSDASNVYDIWDLDWSPDAREIAFTSTHEFDCSLLYSDVYAVGTAGGNYRRISAPPTCDQLADFPTATVKVPVRNYGSDSLVIFMYFLGAPGVQQISLPGFGSGMVTFENVADLGSGVDQYGMMIHADARELAVSTVIDVQPGETHTTAEQQVWTPSSPGWEARSASWHSDGSRLGYAFGFNTIYGTPAYPELLQLGDELVKAEEMPTTVMHLTWNPVAEWANELLYVGWDFDGVSIYWVEEGTEGTPGTALLSFETYEDVLGLAWLPDGNGFVFSRLEEFGEISNLWHYSLETEAVTRITGFTSGFAGDLSVSPDGQEIVFERGSALETGDEIVDPALWTIGLDGGGLRLLKEGAASPDWSGN